MTGKILIIDDEEAIRRSMTVYFAAFGYEVDAAETLVEAEELVLGTEYDVVITDLSLARAQGHEGLEIVRFVRENWPRTATVILTAYGSADVEKRARELGVDCFIHKPVALAKLVEEVRRLLGREAGPSTEL